MNKFTSPLDNIKVASPCSQDWNAMFGTDRKRFCGDCKLNVYNLSGMTKKEAERLLADSEGRVSNLKRLSEIKSELRANV